MVIRSHEMKENGYELEHGGRLMTIFSAPNYCDQMKNKGAFIRWKRVKDEEDRKQFCKDEPLEIRNSNMSQLKNLAYKVVPFSEVPHPDVAAMNYANRMLSMMQSM